MYNSSSEMFRNWFSNAQQKVSKDRPEARLSYSEGKRYVKVIEETYGQKSVFGFIDKSTGAILKPATWNAPAKHARGYISDEHKGMNAITPWGIKYLRR